MTTKTGLAALKKPFSWKFGYHKFQRKIKLQYEKDEELGKSDEGWDLAEQEVGTELPLPGEKVTWDFGVHHKVEGSQQADGVGGGIYTQIPEPLSRFDNGESVPEYENGVVLQPVYVNCLPGEDLEEHVYEHVDILLAQDIYQVPSRVVPIYSNDTLSRHLLPPAGFQDLDLAYILPKDVLYSTVIKPKRKKLRPCLSAMLNKDQDAELRSSLAEDGPADQNAGTSGSGCVLDNGDMQIYENIALHPPADEAIYENVRGEDLASVIEISEDGTWATKDLPPTEVVQAKDEQENAVIAEEGEFLSGESVKIKHAALAYGSQYYLNCPVASVKPHQHNQQQQPPQTEEESRNIGAQIMKQYEQDRQKVRDSLNLPDVSLLDVEVSMEDIAKERRRIIENQAVRAKRIDSWIRNGEVVSELVDEWQGEDPPEGEVVCDSIIQNKHKTKTYWEQLMMAAAASDQAKPQYHKRDRESSVVVTTVTVSAAVDPEDAKPTSDSSEQDFYDARSQISLNSPVDQLEALDDANPGPKIVETVAKKLLQTTTTTTTTTATEHGKQARVGESVVAREIRLQKGREEGGVQEQECATAFQKALTSPMLAAESLVFDAGVSTPTPTSAETKIAQELREMRDREEELRKLRQSLTNGKEEDESLGTTGIAGDETFNSIPNTDEGNYSEYGSEEKELSLDGNNSRMMSPEVPNQGSFSHQRTQSMDSMSSGHSSGSGSGAQPTDSYHRRRITVKPLDEPEEEEVPTYMRSQKETPIEREIRLTREREEELRREKRLPPLGAQQTTLAKPEVRRMRNAITNDPRSVQHRLATNRIQQEINEATEREKELRSAGTIQTVSEDTVDSKVTRFIDLAEYAIEEQDRKLQRAVSTSNIPSTEVNVTAPPAPKPPTMPVLNRSVSSSPLTPSAHSPIRRFGPGLGQKGLMERFLASRGKLTALSPFSNNTSPNFSPMHSPNVGYSGSTNLVTKADRSPMSLPSIPTPKASVIDVTPIDERQLTLDSVEKDRDRTSTLVRKGYKSAEDKIQIELLEMRKREEELRLQRARSFARSQPNLLSIVNDEEQEPTMNGEFDTPMTIGSLRAAQSNPNLLDSEEIDHSEKPSNRVMRKKNAMIAQWENRIQQYTVDH